MLDEVVVKGQGSARSMPDRAALRIAVQGEGPDRESAFVAASRDAQRVDEVLAGQAAALGETVRSGLVVAPKTRWHKGESIRTGWVASRTTTLDVVAFDALGDLVLALVQAGASVAGPTWELAPDNPAYAQARRVAAADARSRATDYAEALGLRLSGVLWVAEPGLRGGSDRDGRVVRAMAASAGAVGGGGDDDAGLELVPAELTVEACVEVGFRLEPASM